MSPENPQTHTQATLPKSKVTALARLKTLGDTFRQRRKAPPSVVFPPPSWVLDDETTNSETINHSAPKPQPVKPPEPVPFAMTLKSLIESLPTEGPWTAKSSEATGSIDKGKQPAPQPVPPGLDNNLVRLLASEDVMNGTRATPAGEGEKSKSNIWNILAGLKDEKKDAGSSKVAIVEEEEDGLMMYSPLEPKADSQVELAKPETVLKPVEEPPPGNIPDTPTLTPIPKQRSASSPLRSSRKDLEKRVWVPSTTELSVLTTWWGYRIYLPPPVMAKLDGKAIKATARAAMIATALKWLLERIPLGIVPPQFRTAVKLLKQLTPLTGYIGVFIAWSWDRVRALDEGNGVVLTATWILPVALLPMTWDAGHIFRPILPPTSEELKAIQEVAAKAAEEARKAAENANKNQSSGQKSQKGERKKSLFRW